MQPQQRKKAELAQSVPATGPTKSRVAHVAQKAHVAQVRGAGKGSFWRPSSAPAAPLVVVIGLWFLFGVCRGSQLGRELIGLRGRVSCRCRKLWHGQLGRKSLWSFVVVVSVVGVSRGSCFVGRFLRVGHCRFLSVRFGLS